MNGRGRKVTPEERALWRSVAGPARRARPAQDDGTAPVASENRAPTPEPAPKAPPAKRVLKPTGRPSPGVTIPAPAVSPPSGLDRRTEQRLRRGKRTPDARIDLHGMTATRAHAALSAFIRQARADGARCVLVITGKGGAGGPRAFGEPAPGVLRREAPVWLSTPPLSSMIVHTTTAHQRHGGNGALYVYLKRPPRP